MAPSEMTTTAFGNAAASGEEYTLPPRRTSVCALAGVAEAMAEPSRPSHSAARSQLANKREALRYPMKRPMLRRWAPTIALWCDLGLDRPCSPGDFILQARSRSGRTCRVRG